MMSNVIKSLMILGLICVMGFSGCESSQDSEFSQEELARMEIESILEGGTHRDSARRSQVEANIQQAESATSKSLRIFEKINEDGSFGYMQVGSKAVRSPQDLITLLESDFKYDIKHGLLIVLSDKRLVAETTNIIEELAEYCKRKNISLWLRSPLSRDSNPYRQLV